MSRHRYHDEKGFFFFVQGIVDDVVNRQVPFDDFRCHVRNAHKSIPHSQDASLTKDRLYCMRYLMKKDILSNAREKYVVHI